ncbi:MAG TPA: bifunctional hydroxymethylpyrimidine kinase/phosphomethylpyrimidine kinase [Burkholderiaceae bacterium]|nr:bifunctional hydroxymethylpyrimidine kinase/phosphomethylpyrimidine kinase [Burkholderiaceae bacterium]
MTQRIPNIATIAGVDPSGGAGVLADTKTISALGGYACAVVAALTAQNTRAVAGVWPVPERFVAEQIDTLWADVRIDACKIGMVGQGPVIEAIAGRLAHWKATHVVLDPVMVAKSGAVLLDRAAVGALRESLLSQASVITPNLPEGGVLLESRAPETLKEMFRAAERLRKLMRGDGDRWVLLKGGHLPGSEAIDLLHDGDRMIELAHVRIDTRNTHGTGCTLSAALATLMPQSPDVPTAARRAKAYLVHALEHADELKVGEGHGPVHHLHALWAAYERCGERFDPESAKRR